MMSSIDFKKNFYFLLRTSQKLKSSHTLLDLWGTSPCSADLSQCRFPYYSLFSNNNSTLSIAIWADCRKFSLPRSTDDVSSIIVYFPTKDLGHRISEHWYTSDVLNRSIVYYSHLLLGKPYSRTVLSYSEVVSPRSLSLQDCVSGD